MTIERKELILTEVLPAREVAKLLGRLDEDKLMFAFARWAEARLRRWVDFREGALLFLVAPGDPDSGMFYLYNRRAGSFWMADLAASRNWGGYREEQFEELARAHGLRDLARQSWRQDQAA